MISGVTIAEESLTAIESVPQDTKQFVFVHVENRAQLLKNSLIALSILDENNQWLVNNHQIVLMGNTTDGTMQSTELASWLNSIQTTARENNNRLIVVYGTKDIELLSKATAQSTNVADAFLPIWLTKQHAVAQVDKFLFLNGGVAKDTPITSVESANSNLKQLLSATDTSSDPQLSLISYQGNSYCHPLFEEGFLNRAIDQWQVTTVFTASNRYPSARVNTRFDNRLFMFRPLENQSELTGIQIAADGDHQLIINGNLSSQEFIESPNRHYPLPYNMSEQELIYFLKTAKITSKTITKEGRTKPLKVALEQDGKTVKGIFKFINRTKRRGRSVSTGKTDDKFIHEVAAYKLSKWLNIDLVPVVTERSYDGRQGTIQLWVDDLTDSISLEAADYQGECDLYAQENLMNSFDYLIMNTDRNLSNVTYSTNDWQIWFIDHSRSFGTSTNVANLTGDLVIKPTAEFKQQLKSLTIEKLKPLKEYLSSRQIDKLIERRDLLIESRVIK